MTWVFGWSFALELARAVMVPLCIACGQHASCGAAGRGQVLLPCRRESQSQARARRVVGRVGQIKGRSRRWMDGGAGSHLPCGADSGTGTSTLVLGRVPATSDGEARHSPASRPGERQRQDILQLGTTTPPPRVKSEMQGGCVTRGDGGVTITWIAGPSLVVANKEECFRSCGRRAGLKRSRGYGKTSPCALACDGETAPVGDGGGGLRGCRERCCRGMAVGDMWRGHDSLLGGDTAVDGQTGPRHGD